MIHTLDEKTRHSHLRRAVKLFEGYSYKNAPFIKDYFVDLNPFSVDFDTPRMEVAKNPSTLISLTNLALLVANYTNLS